jgi:hypothetical protein
MRRIGTRGGDRELRSSRRGNLSLLAVFGKKRPRRLPECIISISAGTGLQWLASWPPSVLLTLHSVRCLSKCAFDTRGHFTGTNHFRYSCHLHPAMQQLVRDTSITNPFSSLDQASTFPLP